MKILDKFIVGTSIFALFSEDFNFHYIIDIKLFYFIILLNLSLLALKKQIYLNKFFFGLISFFIIHGVLNYIVVGSPIDSLIAQLAGISLSCIFYYSLIKTYGKQYLIKVYLQFAFWLAVLAIFMFYLRINVFLNGDRLNGILQEPAHYAAIMLPAVYIYWKQNKYFRVFVLVITIMLSKSSMGYIGLFLMIIIPLFKVKYFMKYVLVVLIPLGAAFYYLYSNWDVNVNSEDSNFFIRRAKQTVESFSAVDDGKFKQSTNLSSYALLSNMFITKTSFLNNPLGSGLGSYGSVYEKYYYSMEPPEYLITIGFSKINKDDANSLFLRMLVDFGVFGLFLIGYFILRASRIFKRNDKVIEQGTFFYLIIKLIREGHYFPPEFYFILLVFIKDFNEDSTHHRRFLDT
ncbi:O-antigen ligase family protein [Aestuariibaculum sp. YM273]|uniref:O-antigen ligase family protein n=1 Tax=Aestuariibaculum sp. YM273 TaxID=3070659 RepID=UPI0027DDF0DB|nr:O-antigen ligase family protein [Aestuariibaculum sp. YM273]WMI66628.1 O-antigen ligase family protein [Aestuariibaculum sp. YM273]